MKMSVTPNSPSETEDIDYSVTNPHNLKQFLNQKEFRSELESESTYSPVKNRYLQFEYEMEEVFEKISELISVTKDKNIDIFNDEKEDVAIYKNGDPRFRNKTLDEIVNERFYYKDKVDWTTRIIPTAEDETD